MDKFDRIYALHGLLAKARLPVSKKIIQEELECSHATVERLIKEMRWYLNAPIQYDREANGYYYDKNSNNKYELPGLWFNTSELYGLLTTYQLLTSIEPGILDTHIEPMIDKIEDLLRLEKIPKGELAQRIRILKMASRKPGAKHFSLVATALLTRKQLKIRYEGRERGEATERTISPQRLIHYRDNWYLDAWCHLRNELRSFSIDRIKHTRLSDVSAEEIDNSKIEAHYTTSYGIFAGEATKIAVIKFNKPVARWVADEQWHPQQKGELNPDGSYELEFPYHDDRELIMDILKYGPDAEVISPKQLRETIKAKLTLAGSLYN